LLKKRGKYWFGDTQADLREVLQRYSRTNGYPAQRFADAACSCSGTSFRLDLDDDEGVAIRVCLDCGDSHPIADSAELLEDADPQTCACPCGREAFEISAGVALYEGSEDVHWLYVGCRCPSCGLTAVYGDWKNESSDYRAPLANV
jgi:Zn ribbon nucleic-acid-binding protein